MKLDDVKTTARLLALVALALVGSLSVSPAIAQNGRIEKGQVTSEGLAANLLGDTATRNYQVYLPPSYDVGTNRYPVIYVLHGYGGNETEQVSAMQSRLNSLIRQRTIGEMMAVFVNGANRLYGSFYLSSSVIGDYETYLTRDLVHLIDGRYRTLNSRESRGITGYSMGGWGSMHLALKYPETFSVAVPQAGVYDALGSFNDGLARQLATFNPSNLAQFNDLPFPVNASAAMFAGLTPNPDRPGLYTDYLYERVNGEILLIDSVRARVQLGDVQHGDLARYLLQSIRLRGIRIVHGTSDAVVPISEARQFTNALAVAGVAFEYQEHPGGHVYRPELALPFLSAHLEGAEFHIAPPRLAVTLGANGLQMAFPTQTNVLYMIESAAALDGGVSNWTERTRVIGDGQTASVTLTRDGQAQFFRVKAANRP